MVETHESHEYRDFEIPVEVRSSIREIERCLRDAQYGDQQQIRDHLDFLEETEAEVAQALAIERSIGRSNYTLKHDQEKIQTLMRRLKELLDERDRVQA
jgi:hypothetical protein